VTIHDTAAVDLTAVVAPTAIVGSQFRPLLDGRQVSAESKAVIGPRVWIGQYTTVGQGATIGADSKIEDFVCVQPQSAIGSRVVVATRSYVGIGATVGEDSVIKGHIGDNAQVGAHCRIAGDLIHRQLDPTIPWDDPAAEEPAPIIEDGVFVGWRAMIVGDVKIGAGAYVCAGALITKDVPAGHIARGQNQIMHPNTWSGALGKSPFFQDLHDPLADGQPKADVWIGIRWTGRVGRGIGRRSRRGASRVA
jgi:UDP-3-O-[3-hydroxymyristoyl] glucosamine N-acyltransferase